MFSVKSSSWIIDSWNKSTQRHEDHLHTDINHLIIISVTFFTDVNVSMIVFKSSLFNPSLTRFYSDLWIKVSKVYSPFIWAATCLLCPGENESKVFIRVQQLRVYLCGNHLTEIKMCEFLILKRKMSLIPGKTTCPPDNKRTKHIFFEKHKVFFSNSRCYPACRISAATYCLNYVCAAEQKPALTMFT